MDDVKKYYDRHPEEDRLKWGAFQLEFERTKDILGRILPRPPARILDVGGAAGAYSLWLAEGRYEVHLVDASARLVDVARQRNAAASRKIASLSVADARELPQTDAFAESVLVFGPLYHLVSREDRLQALREANRVLVPGGRVVVAAISRFASTLDGLFRKLHLDPEFVAIRDRDLLDGQHRNETNHPDYFTTAYFHRPEDLVEELATAGFGEVEVLAVEGPAWLLSDFDAQWADPELRRGILDVARALEREPTTLGVSAHLLGVGRKV